MSTELMLIDDDPIWNDAVQMVQAATEEKRYIDTVTALHALASHKVPASWISTRQGRGGKVLRYIKHQKVKAILGLLFPGFSFVPNEARFFGKGTMQGGDKREYPLSASVTASLEVPFMFKGKDGTVYQQLKRVGGTGAFMNDLKLDYAMAAAAAESMAWTKCFTNMTGIGLEFYDADESEETAESVLSSLVELGKRYKLTEADVRAIGRDQGVTTLKDLLNADVHQRVMDAIMEAGIRKKDAARQPTNNSKPAEKEPAKKK